MYSKIIVPLDGSKLAEQVLPHLQQIAKGCGVTEVLLVTVTEKIKGGANIKEHDMDLSNAHDAPNIVVADRYYSGGALSIKTTNMVKVHMGKMAKTGYDYLVKIADNLQKQDIPSSVVVLIGDVAEEIVHFAKRENADLIIMASKGKARVRKGDVAGAADKVFKLVENMPLLLVKPPYGFIETKPVRKGKPN
ncbi:MAG: universal stress protein [Dehalococcoidales bacterium]|nr:universal stress protein [Dehalococcoidales bacterium]